MFYFDQHHAVKQSSSDMGWSLGDQHVVDAHIDNCNISIEIFDVLYRDMSILHYLKPRSTNF